MKTDIRIARETPLKPIQEVASALDRALNDVRPYGFYAAQFPHTNIDLSSVNKNKLILAAAIMPTKAGIGKNAVLALQEPSLVPCFGMKGDGYTQILPMEDINLHFTGVFHAVTSAHNMISALVRYKVRI